MKEQQFIEKLREARALIEHGWTQSVYARDAYLRHVAIDSPKAVCFCLAGALRRVGLQPSVNYKSYFKGEPGVLTTWNDAPERTKDEVLACLDNSIAALQ